MLKPTQTKIYIIAVILLIGLSLSAQFNVKVGYEFNRSSEEVYNTIVNSYNEQLSASLDELDNPLSQIRNRSGIALGVRYRYNTAAIELFTHRTSGDSEAEGFTTSGSEYSEKISTSNLYYGIAAENQFGIIGFGASIGYETLKFKNKINDRDSNREFLNQRELASRLYLNFEFPSNNISCSIKPYYHFSLGEYNLIPFKNELAPDVNINTSDLLIKPSSWGVTLILYNGPQPD